MAKNRGFKGWFVALPVYLQVFFPLIILYITYKLLQYVIAKFTDGVSKTQAVDYANGVNVPDPVSSIREGWLIDIAKFIDGEVNSWFLFRSDLVFNRLKSLQNKQEVKYLSFYYQKTYNKSLRVLMEEKLTGVIGGYIGWTFGNLPSFVKDNLS